MPRTYRTPDDILRMTAEMREAHDNPDPRPKLQQGNPEAVGVDEYRTVLARLRDGPLSRKEIREVAAKTGSAADRVIGLIDAGLEGLETAGGMRGPGPAAYGGSGRPAVATPIITTRGGVHKLRGFSANGRFYSGLPEEPATLPQERKPTRIHHGSPSSSGFGQIDVNPRETSGFVFGLGASFSRRRSVARDLYAVGDEYDGPTGREGYRSGYVRKGANIADMDFSRMSGKEFFATLTPEELTRLRSLAEGETRQQMRTGKTISAWQSINEALDNPTSNRPTKDRPASGAGYVFTIISQLGREKGNAGAKFIQDYFKNRGYDGVSYRNGNNYEDEVLLFDPKRDFIEDQATDTPQNALDVQQAAKGGNASESSGVPKGTKYGLRPDGTPKGSGWLGELKLPGGGVATEYSVGVNIGGREMDIPSLVPTLTKDEVADMVTNIIPRGASVPEPVLLKAVAHAKERIAKGESVWAPEGTNSVSSVRQAAKAGDTGASKPAAVPKGHNPALDGYSGPRIVINPSTFRNEKDALCVAFDEAFRILMEANGFNPVSEPTEKQRRFFSDTAYADDENMMRRTILARICTFDTSVDDPTDEQLQEAVEFLDTVLEIGAPQNEWEQKAVARIRNVVAESLRGRPLEPAESEAPPETELDDGVPADPGQPDGRPGVGDL